MEGGCGTEANLQWQWIILYGFIMVGLSNVAQSPETFFRGGLSEYVPPSHDGFTVPSHCSPICLRPREPWRDSPHRRPQAAVEAVILDGDGKLIHLVGLRQERPQLEQARRQVRYRRRRGLLDMVGGLTTAPHFSRDVTTGGPSPTPPHRRWT